jgi:RNA polymerase sigma-70 factor (ECF subfamily)
LSTALAQAPPADATRLLYEQHSSRIFGFCLSRLGSREEAEDAVQTTFLNAQRGLGRGVVPEYELAWLFKIAQNVCHNRHQSARRRGRVEAAHDLDALQDVIASPERSAPVSLGELTNALGAIPTRQRRALLLREFQGYSYEEIATELGISVAAVETLLFRARRAVAQQLEQAGATAGTRRGAAASVIELFRWLFGGATAPLKLAAATVAVTTAVATTAVTHQPTGRHQPAATPTPAANTVHTVVPAGKTERTTAARTPARAATVATAAAPTSAPALSPPRAPAGREPTPPSGATPAGTDSASPLAPATAALPALVPEVPALEVALPISTPDLTLPAVTLPAVTLPALTLPATDLPKLP